MNKLTKAGFLILIVSGVVILTRATTPVGSSLRDTLYWIAFIMILCGGSLLIFSWVTRPTSEHPDFP